MENYTVASPYYNETITFTKDHQDFGDMDEKRKNFLQNVLFKNFDITNRDQETINVAPISNNQNKIILKFTDSHIFKSKFGYGLRLNASKGVWLKYWQVQQINGRTNISDYIAVLDKKFFKVVDFTWSDEFSDDPVTFEQLKDVAISQGYQLWKK